jgi:hypothetical protein
MPDTKPTPLIEKVEDLPSTKFRTTEPIYTNVLDQIKKQPKGTYKINIQNKTPNTIYTMLTKHIKKQNLSNLKAHRRDNTIYITKQ